MSKRLEEHLLKAEIMIREVQLKGGAAGRLSFSIKCDELSLSRQKEKHSLQDDRCLPFQRFEFQVVSEFESVTNSYRPKQVSVAVQLESQGGNSVVGSVRLNLLEWGLAERRWELPLQNCPPGSKIILDTKSQLITKKPQLSRDILISDPYSLANSKRPNNDRRASAINELTAKDSKLKESLFHDRQKDSLYNDRQKESHYNERQKEYHYNDRQESAYERQENEKKEKLLNKTKRVESAKNLGLGGTGGLGKVGTGKGFSPRSTIHEVSEKTKPFDEMENLKRRMEEERAEKVRSISKLKMEMSPRLLDPLQQDDSELSKMREKLRNLERKERNYEITIEELSNDIEKRKAKQLQLEKQKEELERALGEKEIKLRSAQAALRTLTEQLDSTANKERVLSRKGEAKETVLKEQMKRLEERLKEAEEESMKAMNEKNEVIKNVAEAEKKHQLALKEREARIIEEKNKHQKSREEWSKADRDYSTAINDLNNSLQDLAKEKTAAQQRVDELEGQLFKVLAESQELKEALKGEREQARAREEEQDKLQGSEMSAVRKRLNELTTESASWREKVKRLESGKADQEAKIKELEEAVRSKQGELGKANARNAALKKEVEAAVEEGARRGREAETLRQTVGSLSSRVAETREKAEGEKARREESNRELEKQSALLGRQRESLEGEIQELKWVIVRNNDKLAENDYEAKQLHATILKLNAELITNAQRVAALEEKAAQLLADHDRQARDRAAAELRSRELAEALRMKTAEAEEEKRGRARAEAKGEEERERASQYLASYREREAQEEARQKEREELLKRKSEDIGSLELELAKKNEEAAALRNANELVLREVHLSKLEADALKNELHFAAADNNALRTQLAQLQAALKAAEGEAAAAREGAEFQAKRSEAARKELEEYRANVERALENLVGELGREEESHNVVATTLLPFPDKKLSTLQVELVQKRNAALARQRQRLAELQGEKALLEGQVREVKALFERREAEGKKQEGEERERLKTLLYDNVMEKNALIEQLNREKQELEQICREAEKLKAEILAKLDNEQELNGQLQILLLEYDALKADNTELTNHLYRLKEEDIRTKADYEQRLLHLQDEAAQAVEKAKLQLNEREKRVIALEKELLESGEKVRRSEEQRRRAQEEQEQLGEKMRQLDALNSAAHLDITKLNNLLRNSDKKHAQLNELIDRLDNDNKQLATRNELLQQTHAKLQAEAAEAAILHDQLAAELGNARERAAEVGKLLQEKGESSKEKLERKMEENSQLKNRLVEKEADLSLKDFFLRQKEQQHALLLQQLNDHAAALAALKARNKELAELADAHEVRLRDLSRELEQAQHDAQQKEDLISRCNFALFSLQSELEEALKLQPLLDAKEKDCIRLREEKNEVEQYYIGELKKQRETVLALKRELASERDSSERAAQEHHLSLKNAEASNSEKYNYLQGEFEREKEEFYRRVEEIEDHNKKVIGELEYRIDRAREEQQEAKQLEKALRDELYKKDNAIISLRRRVDAADKDAEEAKQKHNRYYLLYEEAKAELDTLHHQHQQQLTNALAQLRNALHKQFATRQADALRKVERLRHNQEMDLKADALSRRELKTLLDRVFGKVAEVLEGLKEGEEREGQLQDFKQSRS